MPVTQSGETDFVNQAQAGRDLIERAIIGLLQARAEGLTNAQIARELMLETGLKTGQKNYLTWSILKELVARGLVGTSPKQKGSGVLFVPVTKAGQC
jgi:hypothetical protein